MVVTEENESMLLRLSERGLNSFSRTLRKLISAVSCIPDGCLQVIYAATRLHLWSCSCATSQSLEISSFEL